MFSNIVNNYSHAAVIIQVPDLEKTLVYYTDNLGFEISFKWGEPLEYVVGKLGKSIHLHFAKTSTEISSNTTLYIFVHDVDLLYKSISEKNLKIINDIGNRDYGMRDFDILDLNNNRLTFGTSIDLITDI